MSEMLSVQTIDVGADICFYLAGISKEHWWILISHKCQRLG